MKKKLSLRALEKKLDRIFSEYSRYRFADARGIVQCVTCTARKHWRSLHAGHFIKRQHRATRWRPTNVHPQCVSCNTYRGGMQDEYARFIVNTYGLAEFHDLMEAKHRLMKPTRADLESMIENYTNQVAALEFKVAA